MTNLTKEQLQLFEQLHSSRLDACKIFNQKDFRGVWTSIVDKYPESAHFIYELLQNADDAEATEVNITIKQDEMLFKHNGKKHFDISSKDSEKVGDLNSITGIGDSSKADNQNKIGKFGVGFKAVFQYTNTPEIYDDIFKFRIENYIVPYLLECDRPERNEGETLFVFPYKDGEKSHREIVSRLDNLQNPILFLSNLSYITIKVEGSNSLEDRILSYSKECIESTIFENSIKLSRYQLKEPRKDSSIFLFSKKVNLADEYFGESDIHDIHIGFYYDENKEQLITNTKQNIFCFFPTKESFNSCFVSHAPFLLTDNRQNLKPNEPLNMALVMALSDLAAQSVVLLRDYGINNHNLLINENLTEIIPSYIKDVWGELNPVFEKPMFEAFNRILLREKLLLSRNNVYLGIKESYIGSPRELVDLLSKEQLNLLKKSKDKFDFLKWELSQNINNKNRVGAYKYVNDYTSENFAKDITAEFMSLQGVKWVTRMYTFLRTAAPKLWKLTGNEKSKNYSSLPFRFAPIIKSQKGEWIAPYTFDNKPNIYFPISNTEVSKAGVNVSNYNFVHQEYIDNELALKFFVELEIKEPNEFDYIRTIVLEKYNKDDAYIEDAEMISDLDILITYYKKNPKNLSEFISIVKDKILFAINKQEDGVTLMEHPTNIIYYPNNELLLYFRNDEVDFLNVDYYKPLIEKHGEAVFSEFVGIIGIQERPQIIDRDDEYTKKVNFETYKEILLGDYSNFTINDYELHGFSFAVLNISKELSIYIWNEVLSKIEFSKYENLVVRYRKKYARNFDFAYFMSSFRTLLRTKKWIFDDSGTEFSAEDIPLEKLAPEYERNSRLIQFLGIEKKEKSILELGGTAEQQSQLDLGKRVSALAGDELSEQEIIQAIAEAKAKKRNIRQLSKENSTMDTSSENGVSDENIEDKLSKKWEEKSKTKINRPSHVGAPLIGSDGFMNNKNMNQSNGNDQPFFDTSKYNSNKSEVPDIQNNSKAERKLKSRDTEAQEAAQVAHEQVEILELLKKTEVYTFKWYKLLMELMHANKSLKSDRHAQIDFSEWKIQCSDKILHLLNPSAPVPSWLTDSDQFVLSSLGTNPKTIKGLIIKSDEYSVDISIEHTEEIETICKKAKRIRLIAENTTNIIDSLEKRFLQLGFEDDYNLNDNLPQNIHFIYGPPGTGKTTTLVKNVREIIEKSSNRMNILILTPTNKSADVIAEKMVNDDVCFNYLSRFGATEKLFLIEDAAVVTNRDTMDMNLSQKNIVVTTAARYTYDCLQPDDVFLCDYNWDYIFVDEASMIDLVTITYILYKGSKSKIIVAGDPKQIEPVSQNDMPTYNVYDLVGLHGFSDAINNYNRYPVTSLTTQYRSIPSIGDLVSRFAYNGIVKSDPQRAPQKPLKLTGLDIKDVNFIGFDIIDLDLIKGLSSISGSAFHLYSAIFTYNFANYIVKQIEENNLGSDYSIGIVCPYKAQADAIKQMIDNRPIESEYCSVTCGTVHSFQGDECDIMLIVLNPPLNCSQGAHINNENIINVAMSRAKDYMFFIMPSGQTPGFTVKNELGRLAKNKSIKMCSDIETVMFGSSDYIASNTHVTCHMPVNVYCEENSIYEVRMSDTAIDIKINR